LVVRRRTSPLLKTGFPSKSQSVSLNPKFSTSFPLMFIDAGSTFVDITTFIPIPTVR